MIYDTIDNVSVYHGLGERFAAGFQFLRGTDFASLPAGRLDLQGDALYALVQRYTTKPPEQGLWEAHHRYIDIQYMVSGQEAIGFAHLTQLQPGEYQPQVDFLPLSGSGRELVLFPTAFAIFYPQDAHMPGLALRSPEPVVKVVLKLRIAD